MNLFIFTKRGRIICKDVLRNECNTYLLASMNEDINLSRHDSNPLIA